MERSLDVTFDLEILIEVGYGWKFPENAVIAQIFSKAEIIIIFFLTCASLPTPSPLSP